MVEPKVGRIEFRRGGDVEVVKKNVLVTVKPGERAANMNPGGGGYGDPFERPVEKVAWDVKNGLVSIDGARMDYGVVFKDAGTLEVDAAATARLRGALAVAAE
jgi:N-methylhydantoinase B